MRHLLSAALVLLSIAYARADLQVFIETERNSFVLYEAVPIKVTIKNNSENDVVLKNIGNRPWLSFLITKPDGNSVRPDRASNIDLCVLKPGESKGMTVNITPLYSIRETGQYKVKAVVELEGTEIISAGYQFNVSNGQTIWTEKRPYQGSEVIYSIVRFAPSVENTNLYLRVEDVQENVVYTNALLGEVIAFSPPRCSFDSNGKLHILHLQGQGLYRYTRVDPLGKIESGVNYFRINNDMPTLKKTSDGLILVAGGKILEDHPKERLSDAPRLGAPAAVR